MCVCVCVFFCRVGGLDARSPNYVHVPPDIYASNNRDASETGDRSRRAQRAVNSREREGESENEKYDFVFCRVGGLNASQVTYYVHVPPYICKQQPLCLR